jgi:hypothetical protein
VSPLCAYVPVSVCVCFHGGKGESRAVGGGEGRGLRAWACANTHMCCMFVCVCVCVWVGGGGVCVCARARLHVQCTGMLHASPACLQSPHALTLHYHHRAECRSCCDIRLYNVEGVHSPMFGGIGAVLARIGNPAICQTLNMLWGDRAPCSAGRTPQLWNSSAVHPEH